jgi:hypothetical protein
MGNTDGGFSCTIIKLNGGLSTTGGLQYVTILNGEDMEVS